MSVLVKEGEDNQYFDEQGVKIDDETLFDDNLDNYAKATVNNKRYDNKNDYNTNFLYSVNLHIGLFLCYTNY